jgi:hypothetical protein
MRINSELMDAQLENKGSDVTPASTAKGLIYYKSTTEPIKVSDGTTVHKVLTDQMAGAIADLVEGELEIEGSQVTVNYAIGADNTVSFSTTSTSYVDVTNLTVSFTSTGKPVMITMIPDGTTSMVQVSRVGNALATATFKVLRGATSLNEINCGNGDSSAVQIQLPPGSFQWVDTPAAGTYTYKIQGLTNSGSTTLLVMNCKIFVREL